MQLAIPAGGEEEARAFYSGLLGFTEIEKPPSLKARGGAWFQLDAIELHLGVEAEFSPARKAHPGLWWDEVEALATRLGVAGYPADWDDTIPGRRRFHTFDPFGNRLEFLEDSVR